MSRRLLNLLGLLAVASGCAPAGPPPAVLALPPSPGRAVCGWEDLEQGASVLRVPAQGAVPKASAGTQRLLLDADAETSFGRIKQALNPAGESLVRVKVVVQGKWLLPVTFPRREPAEPPKPSETTQTVVGSHRIKRKQGAPIDRFAEVRVNGAELELFLEGAGSEGTAVTAAELPALLRQQHPAPQVFALRATDETAFKHLLAALRAAACYDRGPGQEPREVILRAEPARIWR